MRHNETSEPEIPLEGGEVNSVVKVGNTVRRTSGTWTPSVQRVLAHLRDAGFAYSPHPLGLDERRREIVSFMPGAPPTVPWPRVLLEDDGVHQIASMVASLTRALCTYAIRPEDQWRHGGVPDPPEKPPISQTKTLRHGDLGLWNTLWQEDRLTGLIDWDYLEPAPPLWDFAQLCWYLAPIRPTQWATLGFRSEPDLDRRLNIIAEHACHPPSELVKVLDDVMALEQTRTSHWGPAGRRPWDHFLAAGYLRDIETDREFLRHYRETARLR